MLTLAAVLVVCCAALVVRACRPDPTRGRKHAGSERAPTPGRRGDPGGSGEGQPPDTAYRRHRWSARRARLELTASGMRRTGEAVRFCLDCPAEKSEPRASTESRT